jgi:uncharacterized protein (UPF0335 family)
VASAGELVVDQGVIREITRRSGHYQPTAEQLNQFVDRIDKSGIELSDIKVEQVSDVYKHKLYKNTII